MTSVEEALAAVFHGASAVGLVSEMPSGPGVVAESRITEIVSIIPPAVGTFLLTSKVDTEAIIQQQRRCRVNTLQIVDRLKSGTYEDLRKALPGISIVQVIHVSGKESVEEAVDCSRNGVDGILLDSGSKGGVAKELGGTGRTHDWQLSRTIRQQVSVPVFLAGGLNPTNVSEAIEIVQPFGDRCLFGGPNGRATR